MSQHLETYQEIFVALQELYKTSLVLFELEKNTLHTKSMEDNTDIAFACREIDRFLDDLGKEVRKHQRTAETFACSKYLAQSEVEPIRTEYCSATPDVKEGVTLPHRDSEEYRLLLEHFGIPEYCRNIVRIHWPTLTDYIADRDSKGLPPTPGIDFSKAKSVFKLTIRKKKNLLDEYERNQ